MLIARAGTESWNVEHGWHWMFAAGIVPAALFGIVLLFSKESPRWLMKVGRESRAQQVLAIINGQEAAGTEVAAIHASLAEERGHLKELFAGPFRKALLIGCLLAAFSQTSGITAILSFLPNVFRSAGQNASGAVFQSVLVGIGLSLRGVLVSHQAIRNRHSNNRHAFCGRPCNRQRRCLLGDHL